MFRLRVALLTLVAVGCSTPTEEPQPYPVVWSWSTASARTVDLRFLLPVSTPNCQTDSVSVTGPGLNGPLQLVCYENRGAAFFGTVDLGAVGPVPPLAYTFAATLGGMTGTHVATVNCYLDLPVATFPLPNDTVPSQVRLSWIRAPGTTGVEYKVGLGLVGVDPTSYSVMDQSFLAVTLPPGTYSWGIGAVPVGLYDGSSALRCGSEWSAGSFTVQ